MIVVSTKVAIVIFLSGIVFSFLTVPPVVAQRLLDRFVPYVLKIDRQQKQQGALRGWGSFEGYLYQRDSLHGWRQVLGGMVDFWRKDSTFLLSFVGAIEFLANFNNDISFNPRAQFWEEGLLFTFFTRPWIVQTGYLHRCKHDIDNLALRQERTLIYGSYFVSLYATFASSLLGVSSHLYLVHEDYRTPKEFEQFAPRLSTLLNTVVLFAKFPVPKTGEKLTLQSSVQLSIFTEAEEFLARFRSRLSVSPSLYGAMEYHLGTVSRIRLSLEYLHDALVATKPESTFQIQLGLSFVPPEMW